MTLLRLHFVLTLCAFGLIIPTVAPSAAEARPVNERTVKSRSKKTKKKAARKRRKKVKKRKGFFGKAGVKKTRRKKRRSKSKKGKRKAVPKQIATRPLCSLGPVPSVRFPIAPAVKAIFKQTQVIDGTMTLDKQGDCCKSKPAKCKVADAEQDQTCYNRIKYSDYRQITTETGINVGASGYNDRYGAWLQNRQNVDKGIKLILTSNDLDVVQADDLYGNLLYIQTWDDEHKGMTPERLATHTFNLGLRVAQLAYNSGKNASHGTTYAGGSNQDEMALPAIGERLAKALLDNYVLLDVSHVGTDSALRLIEIAEERKLPVLSNHSNAIGVFDDRVDHGCGGNKSRNHTDAVICAVARSGGVVGVTPIRFMLAPIKRVNGKCVRQAASENDFIQHIDYIARGVKCTSKRGTPIKMINHVGVGSDGAVNGYNPKDTWLHTKTGRRLNRWARIATRLHTECGYSKTDLKKIFGQNFERAYRAGLPGLRPPVLTGPKTLKLPFGKAKNAVTWRRAKVNSPVDAPIPGPTGYTVTLQRLSGKGYVAVTSSEVGAALRHDLGKLRKGAYRVRVTATNGVTEVHSKWRKFFR